MTSSALQSRKWQLIGMSQWCRSALCGHPFPALTDNWTHGAPSRHIIAPISHTRPSPRSRRYYSFRVPLRVGDWVGLSLKAQYVAMFIVKTPDCCCSKAEMWLLKITLSIKHRCSSHSHQLHGLTVFPPVLLHSFGQSLTAAGSWWIRMNMHMCLTSYDTIQYCV